MGGVAGCEIHPVNGFAFAHKIPMDPRDPTCSGSHKIFDVSSKNLLRTTLFETTLREKGSTCIYQVFVELFLGI